MVRGEGLQVEGEVVQVEGVRVGVEEEGLTKDPSSSMVQGTSRETKL